MITASWMKCRQCGQQCSEYRCRDRGRQDGKAPQPDADGQWIITICSHCKRFMGYRPSEMAKARGK